MGKVATLFSHEMGKRCFSATGKAIVAGGYLVLEPQYRALVVALSARMHAVVAVSCDAKSFIVDVQSPQFKEGHWRYEEGKEIHNRRNPFVEATVETVRAYAEELKPVEKLEVNITMYSDAEYHSQEGATKRTSHDGKRVFLFHEKEITKVAKTGLGSSAGLVTSLTAALLSVLVEGFDAKDLKWKRAVHNLAQVAHCRAQGKIGSGFDVASATFGSIFYQRFDPQLINDVLTVREETPDKFGRALVALVDSDWGMTCEPCRVPKGFTLMMGDVQGGSETPKMVAQVNAWRKKEPELAMQVWKSLSENNAKVIAGFENLQRVSQLDPKRYELILAYTASHKGDDFRESGQFPEITTIAKAIEEIRQSFRVITARSGAHIEPQSQTALLDACWELPGVLGGVVPGAGGYDAVCLIVNQSQERSIRAHREPPLANIRWMDLHEESEGLVEEDSASFGGL